MSLSALQDLTNRAKRPGLAFGVATIGESQDLFPEEMRMLSRAVPKRRAEYAAGRRAARRALQACGLAPCAIPSDADRVPIWPAGFVGSISHDDDLAVAVIGSARKWLGLGIDLEKASAMLPEVIDEIARPEERVAFSGDPSLEARRLFSAKEAAFKAQFPITRLMFGFHAMQVSLAKGTAVFTDHPDCDGIKADHRAFVIPVEQWREPALILSLSAIAR